MSRLFRRLSLQPNQQGARGWRRKTRVGKSLISNGGEERGLTFPTPGTRNIGILLFLGHSLLENFGKETPSPVFPGPENPDSFGSGRKESHDSPDRRSLSRFPGRFCLRPR